MCAQEKARVAMEEGERMNLSFSKRKKKDHAKYKSKIHVKLDIKKESKCFFCKKKGHMKKECFKYKDCLHKKGI